MTRPPTAIVALDVPDAARAFALIERLGAAADFVKVGLQLYVAEGPALVRALRARGYRVFLDLKLHDIPNTLAGAVRSAAALDVELLTLHASGGVAMLRAAREAAGPRGAGGPKLLAVTVLTSLDDGELAHAWGRERASAEDEVVRLARLAREAEMDGVVASVHEARAVRAELGTELRILAPGIRFAGGAAGDQSRVATPASAAEAGVDYAVLGRAVTAAPDPALALRTALAELSGVHTEAVS